MTISYRAPARTRVARGGPPAVVQLMRDHLTALACAHHAVRLAGGDAPGLADALDIADRQAKGLAALADGLDDQV